MKRFIIKIIIFCMIIVVNSNPTMAEARKAKVVLKMATIAPKGHAMTKRMDEFNADVIKATKNEVSFKIYWGGVQGDDNNVLRKIRLGQLHGGFFSGYSLGNLVPEIRVTELPYIFNNDDEVKFVRDELSETMNGFFDKKGFIVLGGFIDIGFMYLFSKEPITSVEELQKVKCWVPGEDKLAQSFYKSMNIQPVPLSVNDVMTSVSTNLIDSAGMTPFGAITFRWYTKFNYMLDYPMLNVVGANIVSKRIWKKISPENQKIIIEIADRYSEMQKEDLRLANSESVELLQKAGIQLTHVDVHKNPEKIQFLFDAGVTAREEQVDVLYTRDLMNKTLSLINEYRKRGEHATGLPLADKY